MSSPRRRRAVAPLVLVLALAACAHQAPEAVRTGSDPSAASGPTEASPTTAAVPVTTATTASSVPTPTVAGSAGAPAASPVDGLTPAELRTAVEAPASVSTRAVSGPVAERVVVGGRSVWRVRIPGSFPVRSARVQVLVGSRIVGLGLEGPDLGALLAVTVDGSGLVAGAPVSYQWEGSRPVAAGRLVVAR